LYRSPPIARASFVASSARGLRFGDLPLDVRLDRGLWDEGLTAGLHYRDQAGVCLLVELCTTEAAKTARVLDRVRSFSI